MIPTTSFDAIWYGVAQWLGVTSLDEMEYILPNSNNFGCRIFSETNLFDAGTGLVPGCAGDSLELVQTFDIDEPRFMTGEEQKAFCNLVRCEWTCEKKTCSKISY